MPQFRLSVSSQVNVLLPIFSLLAGFAEHGVGYMDIDVFVKEGVIVFWGFRRARRRFRWLRRERLSFSGVNLGS